MAPTSPRLSDRERQFLRDMDRLFIFIGATGLGLVAVVTIAVLAGWVPG